MAQPRKYCIALHGGTMENWTCDATAQAEREGYLKGLAQTAGTMLSNGSTAMDACQYVVMALEDHDAYNAGKGGAMNVDGGHELEAAIVDGETSDYGAVACTKYTKNPICSARGLLNQKSVCFLAGNAADEFAKLAGLEMVENTHFTTPIRLEHFEAWKAGQLAESENLGTVGAVARDIYGNLAAAGSTGGSTCKPIGRIGDTAILGAGLIADRNIAVVCSGHGESILKSNVAATVASLVSANIPLEAALEKTIQKVSKLSGGMPCAILAVDSHGKVHAQSTGRIFSTATASSHALPRASMAQTTISILDQHQFLMDSLIRAGLTRYPTVRGQCVVELLNQRTFSGVDFSTLQTIFKSVNGIVGNLQQVLGPLSFGLITDGGSTMTLMPQKPAVSRLLPAFSDIDQASNISDSNLGLNSELTALGISYSSSSEGEAELDSQALEPLHHYEIGSLQNYQKIWCNEHCFASLSQNGAAPSWKCTLHFSKGAENGSSLPDESRVRAIHDVMHLFKSKWDIAGCGMSVNHFGTEHEVITLFPQLKSELLASPIILSPATFTHTPPEVLTTALGPLSQEYQGLLALTEKLRALTIPPASAPIRSWADPSSHAIKALGDPWYEAMFELQSTFYHACVDFFRKSKGYDYVLAPVTSDCISSPMGLGSDSVPVQVPLFGRNTYLADSMQFTLEYMLRVKKGAKGVYYVSPSFRGEDPDKSHLNQFFHVECELEGGMDDGMEVMEQFVRFVAAALLEKHEALIRSIAGDTEHISNLINFASDSGARFPSVTLDEALAICGDDAAAWEFAVPEAPEKGKKLTRRGEEILIKKYEGAVWLTMMDHLSVPFYQAYADPERLKARCADLLMGIGETGGLGERHTTAAHVEEALLQHEIPPESYQWYMDIRNAKQIRSVGWGMGLERFMLWLLKHDDVRDIAIIPRLKTGKYLP